MMHEPRRTEQHLKVAFGDNDFGLCVSAAVKRIWLDVHRNNAHLIDPVWDGKGHEFHSLTEMFHELHKVGALHPMIARAVDSEHHYEDVENATRGVHSHQFPWNDKVVSKTFKSITDTYLSTDLSFHEYIPEQWANGEDVWLDVENGNVVSR